MIGKMLKTVSGRFLKSKKVKYRVLSKMPNVLNVGNRAVIKKVKVRGKECIRKSFEENEIGLACFERELFADALFRDKPWKVPIVRKGASWFVTPFFSPESRLDHIADAVDETVRLSLAKQVMWILFDIFFAGYAHRDCHPQNMFLVDGQIKLVDFECLEPYPDGQRPPFPFSYDIAGQGMDSPFLTDRMCYGWTGPKPSLQSVLKLSTSELIEEFRRDLKFKLRQACRSFTTRSKRHTCKTERIYSSFTLPHFSVSPAEAQRNTESRLARFGIDRNAVAGKKVLDLGSNIGGVLFSINSLEPKSCTGIEYDRDKVLLSQQMAAFNGLNHYNFIQADIDFTSADSLEGPFDIVFCLAVEGHVKKREKLFSLLSNVTSGVLYFEGNGSADANALRDSLCQAGFPDVEIIGISDDDCVPENNCRPLFIARKR